MSVYAAHFQERLDALDAHMHENGHAYWCGEQDAIADYRRALAQDVDYFREFEAMIND